MNQVEKHLYHQRVMYFVLGWHFYVIVYTLGLETF